MDCIIKHGTVITADATFRADVLLRDGKISGLGESLSAPSGAEVIDASGKLVLPGALDAHVHPAMPFMGTVSADDYFATTRAAACGGTTTIFDFAIQTEGETLLDAVKRREALCAPEACVNYAFHAVITDQNPDNVFLMREAVDYGVSSFKLFMVYAMAVGDDVLFSALEQSRQCGALVAVHAENRGIVELLIRRFLAGGKTTPHYHFLSRPEFVETEAVGRAIELAKSADAPLYIVHLSTAGGLEAITRARDAGQPVFAETCVHYLNFTSEVYDRPDGAKFVCSPPIKGKASQDALWRGIARGDISVVATDHTAYTLAQKEKGKDDFSLIPNGCMGVENMYPYMLGKANGGALSFNKVVALCARNPARMFGCDDRKGHIAPGFDADIVVYDPAKRVTVTQAGQHASTDHTIWEGTEITGYPVITLVRGVAAYRDGAFVGERGAGQFVRCNPVNHRQAWI